MKTTSEFIEGFVDEIKETITILSQSEADGIITLKVDDTQWISLADPLTIDGNQFIVSSFVFQESISLRPLIEGATVDVESFDLLAPNYKHGTIRMTQNEVDAVNDKRELVPFVWLKELIRDEEDFDEESAIDRDVQTRLFFINSGNFSDWTTDDHYEYCIKPLNKLVNSFIKILKSSRFVAEDINYIRTPHVNLSFERNGVSDERVQEKSIFDCNLDGVELNISLSIRKNLNCIKHY